MSLITGEIFEFGPYRLDVTQRVFTRDGQVVPLPPKTFELLLLLVKSPGRAFSKQELMTALWPDTFVEEANLSFQTSVLRKALGEGGARWIETVPKHGYRFRAEVSTASADDAGAAAPVDRDGGGWSIRWTSGGRAKWFAAIGGVSVLCLVSYAVVLRSRTAATAPPAIVPVALTAYDGVASTPALSPDGSKVAFSWFNGTRGSNKDIYVKLVGPGEPQRLTTSTATDDAPAWSPDGRLLAFIRSTSETTDDLLVIPARGGDERRLTVMSVPDPRRRSRRNIAWTPDGKWIALGAQPAHDESHGIWLIAVDRQERRRLTHAPSDHADETPSFSPDGSRLAFIRRKLGAPEVKSAVHVLPLSLDLRASGPPIRVTPEGGARTGLAWTSDGRALVFSSSDHLFGRPHLQKVTLTRRLDELVGQPERLAFGEGAEGVSISRSGRLVYAARFRDSAIWKLPLSTLTDRPVAMPLLSSQFDEHAPDWSPDGKRLAFVSTRSGAEEIWIGDADGSNAVRATSFGGPQTSNPRWSPDGRTILFNSRREGSFDLYLLWPDTGELRRLTDQPTEEFEPRWSRDGRWIYFGSNRTGRTEVWRIPAGGGAGFRITQQGGLTATESPDSKFLYYAKDTSFPTSIWRVPVAGGEEMPVADGLSFPANFVVANQGLYLVAVGQASHQTSIDFVEYGTGHRTTIVNLGKLPWFGTALSPDQRSMLYATVDSTGSNLMLVDAFR